MNSVVMCFFILCLCCSKEDLVVAAPFYHAAGVSGAIYVFYNSDLVCDSLALID